MNNKEKLRQQLMEQTFGKNAKNRSLSSVTMDFENILKQQQDSIEELSKTVDDETLRQINEEMERDFGVSVNETISPQNESKNNSDDFIKVKDALASFYYEDDVDILISFIKKARALNCGEYSLLLYDYKDIHSLLDEFVRLLCQYHYVLHDQIGYLSFYDYTNKIEIFYQDMYDLLYGQSDVVVFDHIEALPVYIIQPLVSLLKNKEMPLNNRYVDVGGSLKETGNQLVKDALSSLKWQNKYIIFLCYSDYHTLTNKVGTAFVKEIDECKAFVDLTGEETQCMIKDRVNDFNVKITKQYPGFDTQPLMDYCLNEKIDDIDAFLQTLTKRLYDVFEQYHDVSILYHDHQLFYKRDEKEELLFDNKEVGFEEIDQRLDSLVGLVKVKDYLKDLKQYYQVINKRKKQGKKTMDVSMHMIFTGNPGTGKTTVARIVAQYLKAAGILSSGQLIEASRKDLVGQYAGHTAMLTSQVISSAIGGVLFIDEAYSLYRGQNDTFGLEAIDTLVKAMEDKRDELVVILAGYRAEMEDFLKANSGLRSRFSRIIDFEDYNGEELYEIACSIAASKDYIIDESCKDDLVFYLEDFNKKEGGNGRLARNIVEKAMINQAGRDSDDDLLILEDFEIERGDSY